MPSTEGGDGTTPATIFSVPSIEQVANRRSWTQLTDANPQVRSLALGEQEEITWKSKDGTQVGGVLVKPVGYEPGKKYPMLVYFYERMPDTHHNFSFPV